MQEGWYEKDLCRRIITFSIPAWEGQDVREVVLDHPLVQHFWEEHGGQEQELMGPVKAHKGLGMPSPGVRHD